MPKQTKKQAFIVNTSSSSSSSSSAPINTCTNTNKTTASNLSQDQLKSKHLYNLIHTIPQSNPISKIYSLQFDKLNSIKSLNVPSQIDNKICNKCGILLIPGLNMTIRIKFRKMKQTQRDNEVENNMSNNKLKQKCLSCGNINYFELSKNTSSNKSQIDNSGVLNQTLPDHSSIPQINVSEKSNVKENVPQNEGEKKEEELIPDQVQQTTEASTQPNRNSIPEPIQETSSSSSPATITAKNKAAKDRSKKRKAETNLLQSLKQRKLDQDSKSKKINSLNLMDFLK
ncbi:SNM1 [Candida jiufengensis]|uniref:SNM1 n=1 Tax=Candida jiufengensis TaxID=497108 RepID=UPI002225A966|nr:SNM1 [Candida jiufengensis]KAI5956499.1 SNM1 [Candida jiufengensis]